MRDFRDDTQFTNTIPLSRKSLFIDDQESSHAFLEILDDKGLKSSEYLLTADDCKIGRTESCDLQLLINHVSRVHAQVICRDETFILEDLASTNGIFVNGIQVSRCILKDGDIIEIGEAKIRYAEEKIRL